MLPRKPLTAGSSQSLSRLLAEAFSAVNGSDKLVAGVRRARRGGGREEAQVRVICMILVSWDAEKRVICVFFCYWDAENHIICVVLGHRDALGHWDAENHVICVVFGH